MAVFVSSLGQPGHRRSVLLHNRPQYHFCRCLQSEALTEPKLVHNLVAQTDDLSLNAEYQVTLALSNLVSDSNYQIAIIKADGPTLLLQLLRSAPSTHSRCRSLRTNTSISPQNESPIIEAGFLNSLFDLLSFKGTRFNAMPSTRCETLLRLQKRTRCKLLRLVRSRRSRV